MINDKRLELKRKFLVYFRELPVQKLAAGYIGKTEDTISLWKAEDSDFSDQITIAKSEWAKEQAKEVKSKEWLLERVMKDHFAPRTEITGAEGGPIPILGTYAIHPNNSHQEIAKPEEEN